eukprot:gnl/MRDRNA2_/MRDRNA2_375612_c0_seq1.p1 gnl/MRDRNA2_/MRDRNA2_375612_c0~~gnl/MRDRNA2_/MRDRNA2_375612_c0_seq1.p1  ORF type:complete len:136 (+),score=26.01 gnl/MRDRNA2_/MRDRNA2_375612_c0_seq1:51-458(+)
MLVQRFGARASALVEKFDPVHLLQFLRAYEQLGGKDETWAKALAAQRVRTYRFPCISLDVALSMQVPTSIMAGKGIAPTSACESATEANNARFAEGMTLWEASFALAEFLSRHGDLAQVAEVQELMGDSCPWWKN